MRATGQWTALALLWRVPAARAVFGGNYVHDIEGSAFRGAVMSGGGSGIVLFRSGDEAVVLTVAHGYDLTTKSAQEAMDDKLDDGGLKQAYGKTDTLCAPTPPSALPSLLPQLADRARRAPPQRWASMGDDSGFGEHHRRKPRPLPLFHLRRRREVPHRQRRQSRRHAGRPVRVRRRGA